MLERDGEEVARATSIVRYARNSSFAPHRHALGEEFLVLEGVFSDETGDFGRGMYVRNPPASKHAPSSVEGCLIFVKLRQMHPDDTARIRIDIRDRALWVQGRQAEMTLPLYRGFNEEVRMCRWSTGAEFPEETFSGGAEYYVLTGSFRDENGTYGQGFWLRLPVHSQQHIEVLEDTVVYRKSGHLGEGGP